MKRADITHLAMRVLKEELPHAEQFYSNLFGMHVAFRETMTKDGWATLPDDPAAALSGTAPQVGLVMLYNDAFAIDLEVRPLPEGQGRYSHLGLQVESNDLEAMRTRAPEAGCNITHSSQKILVFDDPFGMRWELTTYDYSDPKGLSAGRRNGHWYQQESMLER